MRWRTLGRWSVRGLVRVSALFAGVALLTVVVVHPPAEGAARVTRGPYLQAATASEMTILWQTDVPAAPAVEYRLVDAPAEPVWHTVGGSGRARSHAVTLTGLAADSSYRYRIRADSEIVYEGGILRTLKPAEGPGGAGLTFVVYGDNRTNHSPHAAVVRAILREQPLPELLLHTGDLVDRGAQADQWEVFFQIERDLLARVPVFPALGNHEDDSPLYFQSFRFPSNGTGQGAGRWYSFDAGPAHFVALDVVFSDFGPGSPQYRWLERDLTQTDRPWKFVYFHYPPYNASAPHGSNLRVRDALERLFLERKVSVVFAGHAHIYERALGAGTPPLLHLISGGGGAPQHTVGRQPWTQYTESSYHFLRVTIAGDRITTVGVREDGSEFDRFAGQLDADGRLQTITRLAPAVVVPGPTLAQFLGSSRGGMVLGYAALMAVALPLGLAGAARALSTSAGPLPPAVAIAPEPQLLGPPRARRGLPLLKLTAGVVAVLFVVIAASAPLHWLVGFDFYSRLLTVHGLAGVGLVIVAALAANMSYRLAVHHASSLPWISLTAWTAVALSALTAIAGNVLYARYLQSGGPMEQLIRKAPEAHRVLFEFKEYVGLVPLPLAAAAALIVAYYRDELRHDRRLAEVLALVFLLLVAYCLVPLALGAAVTRLRGIL